MKILHLNYSAKCSPDVELALQTIISKWLYNKLKDEVEASLSDPYVKAICMG